jgi:hypothetical protein
MKSLASITGPATPTRNKADYRVEQVPIMTHEKFFAANGTVGH